MNINLEKFKERLKNIEENSYKKKTEPRGLGIGMKISLDLISPIIVGILIGLGFDKIFSTKPVFFLIFLLLGIITGFISVIKSMKSLK
jgi:F0F1-type ATP synthase assembly protein I